MTWRIYIAGPISAKIRFGSTLLTVQEKMERFRAAERFIASIGAEPVVPLDVPVECGLSFQECNTRTKHVGQDGAESHSWECYMKADIRELTRCDAIATLPGWGESPGAKIEFDIARRLFYPHYKFYSSGVADPTGVFMLSNDEFRLVTDMKEHA